MGFGLLQFVLRCWLRRRIRIVERDSRSLQKPFLQIQTEGKGQSIAFNATVMILKRNFTLFLLVSVLLIDISLQFQVSIQSDFRSQKSTVQIRRLTFDLIEYQVSPFQYFNLVRTCIQHFAKLPHIVYLSRRRDNNHMYYVLGF